MNIKHSRSSGKLPYFPILTNIGDSQCLVVGGGVIAERKVRLLLRFGAEIIVVSPRATRGLITLAEKSRIRLVAKEYEENDLNGVVMVFAATNVEEVNRRVKVDAKGRGIPVNVVDNPALCDFIVPSVITKGPIMIAISTSGTLPLLAKKLRKEIEKIVTADYVEYVTILGFFRTKMIARIKNKRKRSAIMKEIGLIEVHELIKMGAGELEERFLGSP